MRRVVVSVTVLLLGVAVLFGWLLFEESGDMYNPPGAARQYVRALLEDDQPLLDSMGTVDPVTRAAVVTQLENVSAGPSDDVGYGGQTSIGERMLREAVVVPTREGTSAIVYVDVDVDRRTVVGIDFVATP